MQLTSLNLPEEIRPEFYKATQQGIQKCTWLSNYEDVKYLEDPILEGYAVDSLFIKIDWTNSTSLMHFDNKGTGFFTTEEEAIECHRQLVVDYINNLNNTTLKSCPINVL